MSNTTIYSGVADAATLSTDIQAIDLASQAGTGAPVAYTIQLAQGSTLTEAAALKAINLRAGDTLDIQGNGASLDGGGAYQGLFVYAGQVTIENLTIADTKAVGGAGGAASYGGGGAAGLGGGLFVGSNVAGDAGQVTLSNVAFSGDSATGGASGAKQGYGYGGGGGLLGGQGGGSNGVFFGAGGGGGIAGAGAVPGATGTAGLVPGGASAGSAQGGGGASGGGGGGGSTAGNLASTDAAAGGGISGAAANQYAGGSGGFGGGGGGGVDTGGGGGFGGGGGGTGYHKAGGGGFGGGGGGDHYGGGGGGFGGGVGGSGGGGGLGAGGDIFVQQGGSLTIGAGSLDTGTVMGGKGNNGGTGGVGLGSGLFIDGIGGTQSVTLDPAAGTTTTIAGVIADETGSQSQLMTGQGTAAGAGALIVDGQGTVSLSAANTYTGGTTLTGGALVVRTNTALGSGTLAMAPGTTLGFSANGLSIANTITVAGDPTYTVAGGMTDTVSGTITDALPATDPGQVEKTGAGTLVLSGTGNTYSGGTTIDGGTLEIASGSSAGTDAITFGTTTPVALKLDATITGSSNAFANTLANLAVGDTIDLAGMTFAGGATATLNGGGTVLTVTSGGASEAFALSGLQAGAGFRAAKDGGTGTLLTAVTAPTLSGVAYDASSGQLTLSGSDLTTVGSDYSLGDLTLTGQGGATFGLGGATITSATTNQLTLSFDYPNRIALGQVLDLDGSNALDGTAYALSGSAGWDLGAASFTNQGVGVSNAFAATGTPGSYLGSAADGATLASLIGAADSAASGRFEIDLTGSVDIGAYTLPTIDLQGSASLDIVGNGHALEGSGTIVIDGSSSATVTLSGNNSYFNVTTLDTGTLVVGDANALGTSEVDLAAGTTLAFAGNYTIANYIYLTGASTVDVATGQTETLSRLADFDQNTHGTLVKTGAGTLVLDAANTYSGGTTIAAGTLAVSADANLGAASGGLAFTGGMLDMTTGFTTARNLTINGPGTGTIQVDAGTGEIDGTISVNGGGGGSLVKTGAGTLILNGDNTYAGGTEISAGTLAVSADDNLGTAPNAVLLTGGTLDMTSGFTTARDLFLYGTGTVEVDQGTGEIDGIVADGASAGTLVVSGAGALALTAANTYTGGTVIDGTLQVYADANLGDASGAVAMSAGVLEISQTGFATSRSVTLQYLDTIEVDAGVDATFAGAISDSANGAGILAIIGQLGAGPASVVTLGGANTFSGGVDVSGATVAVASDGNLGATSGDLNLEFATLEITTSGFASARGVFLDFSGTVQVDTGTAVLSGTIADGQSSAGGGFGSGLLKTGAGTLVLSGANTYSGGTEIDAGTLSLAHVSNGGFDAAGTGAIDVAGAGAALEFATSGSFEGEVDLATGATIEAVTGTVTTLTGTVGVIDKQARIVFGSATDAGTIDFNPAGVSNGAGLGVLEVAGGTLLAGDGGSLNTLTAQVGTVTRIDAGGTLDLGGNATTVTSLTGRGTLTNSATTTIDGGPFGGTIAGTGNVLFAGSAILTGKSTYTGTTRIQPNVTVSLGARASLDDTSQIDVLGALRLSGTDLEAASLTGNGTIAGSGTIGSVVAGTLGYAIAAGAALTFTGSGDRFTRQIGGTGATAIFTAGSDLFLSGIRIGAGLDISGAAVSLGTNLSSSFGLDLSSGSLTLGAYNLSLFGPVDLSGGSLANAAGSLVLRGSSTIEADTTAGARLANVGTLDQTGATTLTFAGPGTLGNAVGATYDIQGDGGITAGARLLSNSGTLEKTGGTHTSSLAGGLVNTGTGLLEAASGTLAVTGNVLNSGTIEATGAATVDLESMVGGRGTLDVEAASILELGAMIGAAQTAKFGSDGGTLQLDAPASFKGTIAGFAGSDTIDVGGFDEFTIILFKANAGDTGGTLTLADASHSVALRFTGQYTAANFAAAANGEVHYQTAGVA